MVYGTGMSNNDSIVVNIPQWMKDLESKQTSGVFDNILKVSNNPYIDEVTFIVNFLPVFAAPADQITQEICENYIARFISVARQPYNSIDVYEKIDANGAGVNLLFTVPPLWNGNAPILKTDATKPPTVEGVEPSKYDSSIFRTLVARINILIAAGDTLQLARYRDAILPHMVQEAPTVEMEHLRQWYKILTRYKIQNDLYAAIQRLLGEELANPSTSTNATGRENSGSSEVILSVDGEDF